MKLFILGLDGLDYNLVEKWNLQNLKQEVYGKIDVPIGIKGFAFTPEVWASFLTGKEIVGLDFKHITSMAKIKYRIKEDIILKPLRYLRSKINLSLGIGGLFRALLKAPYIFPKLKESTFIDRDEIEEINAPYYSYDHTALSTITQFGTSNISLSRTVKELLRIYKKRKEHIMKELKNKIRNSHVVFAYLHFPDTLEHFLFMKPDQLREFYNDLDYFVLQLKDILPEDVLFIIISDHGFDLVSGTHSNYAFYSSSTVLNPEPKKITDFYCLVLKQLGV